MRLAPTLVLVAVLGAATTAFAQPAPDRTPTQAPATADKPKSNPDADAALAIAIRMQKEREEHIARGLCAAGDKSKCPQPDTATPSAPGSQP